VSPAALVTPAPQRVDVTVTTDHLLVRAAVRCAGVAYELPARSRLLQARYVGAIGERLTAGVATAEVLDHVTVPRLARLVAHRSAPLDAWLRAVRPSQRVLLVRHLVGLPGMSGRGAEDALVASLQPLGERYGAGWVLVRVRDHAGERTSAALAAGGFVRVGAVADLRDVVPEGAIDHADRCPDGMVCACPLSFWTNVAAAG
jgi:hypothetical protein